MRSVCCALVALLSSVVLAGGQHAFAADYTPRERAAARILNSLDSQAGETDQVILAARANLRLSADHAHRKPIARRLLREVDRRSIADRGWGLTYAWDAFGDDTINPAHTIYTYTTAMGALAYLDAYEALGDRVYLRRAERAAETIMTTACCWREGRHVSVWYSDQPADHLPDLQVHNVNGLMVAVLSRLREHGVERWRDELLGMTWHLLDSQGDGYESDGTSPHNWAYSAAADRPNDLVHEAFIIEGLVHRPSRRSRVAVRRALRGVLDTHFLADGRPRQGRHTLGSMGWGPGAGVFVLAASSNRQAQQIADRLARSVDKDGRSSLAPEADSRGMAYWALGLARVTPAARR